MEKYFITILLIISSFGVGWYFKPEIKKEINNDVTLGTYTDCKIKASKIISDNPEIDMTQYKKPVIILPNNENIKVKIDGGNNEIDIVGELDRFDRHFASTTQWWDDNDMAQGKDNKPYKLVDPTN